MNNRILIFSTAYLPFVGGAEVAVKEITDRLQGFEFDLITARMDKKLPPFERVGRVNVYRIGWGIETLDKLAVPFLGTRKTWQLLEENSYRNFWCIMATFASGAAYIVNILRGMMGLKKIPIVLTLQEGDSEAHMTYHWGGMTGLSWKLALQRTSHLTAISSYLINRAHRLGYKGRSELIPNGVNIEKFQAVMSSNECAEFKNKLGFTLGEVILITTSRLVKKNGIADVIHALKFLPHNVKFLILGTGPLEEELKQLSHNLEVEERAMFIGLVSHEELPKYLKISDIFIRPSLSEGMGNSFIEAMAAGVPVVATPVGGIVDFLFDPDKNPDKPSTGLFVNVADPMSIAKQVERLMADALLRNTLIENGKKLAVEKYDWNLIAREMKTRVFESTDRINPKS